MTLLLAIDTSTRMTGVALFDGEQVLAECTWRGAGYQTVELAPEIGLLLRKVDSSVDAVRAIAVASGPGSFTGLRIGMALAKGLALSGGRELIGVPTMDIVARSQPRLDRRLYIVIEAGRGRAAGMWYKWGRTGWESEGDIELTAWSDLPEHLSEEAYVCGELPVEVRKNLRKRSHLDHGTPAGCHRRPAYLAEIGWERWKKGKSAGPEEIVPIYITTALDGGG